MTLQEIAVILLILPIFAFTILGFYYFIKYCKYKGINNYFYFTVFFCLSDIFTAFSLILQQKTSFILLLIVIAISFAIDALRAMLAIKHGHNDI